MKKIIITSFLIFTILISCFNTLYAAISVTEEKLQNSLNELKKDYAKTDKITDITMNSASKKIIFSTQSGETVNLSYDLSSKPTFSNEVIIEDGMSYDEYDRQVNNIGIYPMYGYIATLMTTGLSAQDIASYFAIALLSATTESGYDSIPSLPNFEDGVIKYFDATFPLNNAKINDSKLLNTFTISYQKENLTENSRKLKYTITVNPDADFSKIGESTKPSTPNSITKENADYVVTLKLGQKFMIETDSNISWERTTGNIDILDIKNEYRDDHAEITPKSTGTCGVLFNVGKEQKSFYITVEENPKNETLDTKTLKIDDIKEDLLEITDITKENADFFIELKVDETYELSLKDFYGEEVLLPNDCYGENMHTYDYISFKANTDSSKVLITGLKPGVIRGYIFQEVDNIKNKLYYAYISITEKATSDDIPSDIENVSPEPTNPNTNQTVNNSINQNNNQTNTPNKNQTHSPTSKPAQKLPQTGNMVILYLLSTVFCIASICFITIKLNKYKDI